jgi:glutamyl-tRNA reductase
MNIKMVGIDFEKSTLEQREIFSFTKTQVAHAMRSALTLFGLGGCVILSTCNRTEIWVETEQNEQINPATILCVLKQEPPELYADLFIARDGDDAVRHLFETACGLKSQIFGEDQILAQIKTAIECARTEDTAGERLEKLFQLAVTSAKKVKTQVCFTSGSASVASETVSKLKSMRTELFGTTCLVIGNGDMGHRIAEQLAICGADVTVTLRQYKHGISLVPQNCKAIHYDERLQGIENAEIIISATSSPHHTIRYEDVIKSAAIADAAKIYVDLAVPRDIDPRIAELKNSVLLTIDNIECSVRDSEKAHIVFQAMEIIRRYIREFYKSENDRGSLPIIRKLADDFSLRLSKKLADSIKSMGLEQNQTDAIKKLIVQLAENDAKNLLFSFRDWMEDEENHKYFGSVN